MINISAASAHSHWPFLPASRGVRCLRELDSGVPRRFVSLRVILQQQPVVFEILFWSLFPIISIQQQTTLTLTENDRSMMLNYSLICA